MKVYKQFRGFQKREGRRGVEKCDYETEVLVNKKFSVITLRSATVKPRPYFGRMDMPLS